MLVKIAYFHLFVLAWLTLSCMENLTGQEKRIVFLETKISCRPTEYFCAKSACAQRYSVLADHGFKFKE